MGALFHPDGSPVDLGSPLEADPGVPLNHDQVSFLFERIIGMLTGPDGKVIRAASKYDQAAIDIATRVILIGENQLAKPIRVPLEKDIDSRAKFP